MAVRKGIVLAGGRGTRLDPLTRVISKQLLPVYDKPMISYPLAVLMLGGIRDLLVITSAEWHDQYERLLGDGRRLGLKLSYAIQDEPRGLPDAFVVGAEWIGGEPVALILGDNVFYGNLDSFRESLALTSGARLFVVPTQTPERFGIVELDAQGEVVSLEEKPRQPKSDLAAPGLYVFDGTVSERAAALEPSVRGETEIIDLLQTYAAEGALRCTQLGRGVVWLDAGTPDGLLEASTFVATIQKQTRYQVACLEEIAWRRGFIDEAQFAALCRDESNPDRREYLEAVRATG